MISLPKSYEVPIHSRISNLTRECCVHADYYTCTSIVSTLRAVIESSDFPPKLTAIDLIHSCAMSRNPFFLSALGEICIEQLASLMSNQSNSSKLGGDVFEFQEHLPTLSQVSKNYFDRDCWFTSQSGLISLVRLGTRSLKLYALHTLGFR